MKKISIVLGIIILIIICWIFSNKINNNLESLRNSVDYYKSLKLDTDFTVITKKIGEPDADIGSGIHIFVYKLSNGDEVWIGSADLKRLIYIKQKKDDGTMIDLVTE